MATHSSTAGFGDLQSNSDTTFMSSNTYMIAINQMMGVRVPFYVAVIPDPLRHPDRNTAEQYPQDSESAIHDRLLLKGSGFRAKDAECMIIVGKIDEAAAYLLKQADQIDGCYCGSLRQWNRIIGILSPACRVRSWNVDAPKCITMKSNILEKLDELSVVIADWKDFDYHEAFREQIMKAYGPKKVSAQSMGRGNERKMLSSENTTAGHRVRNLASFGGSRQYHTGSVARYDAVS